MEKQLKGNRISFNADIKKFQADGTALTVTLVTDATKVNLNALNEILNNDVTVDLTSVQTELIPEKEEAN